MLRFKLAAFAAAFAMTAACSAFASDIVKSTAAPTSAAAQTATTSNAAVIDKGITSTTITVPASSEPQQYQIDLKPLIDGLLPYIISAVGGLILALSGVVAAWLKQKWNIDIDQAHRDAWQQAAANAAGALIARGAVQIEQSGKVHVDNAAMAQVINTVISRVPAAIKHFGYTPEDVEHLIRAKVPQVLTGATPSAIVVG